MKLSKKHLATPSIEPLESRIAPATFLVSGGSGAGALKIFKIIGNFPTVPTDALTAAADATNQGAAAITFSGATATALLNAGDKLYFDTNGDQMLASTGEPLLVQVKSGKARVFWTDSTSTGTQGQLEASELTGILVSGGSKLEVTNTDVFGSILTGLDATGTFTTNGASLIPPLAASIAKLTVTGAVFGDIGATGSISNLVLGKQITNPLITGGSSARSVSGIFAGSVVDQLSFDLDGSGIYSKSVDFSAFYQNAPVAGAFVDGVNTTGAVDFIYAGSGSDVPAGAGKPGGRIEGINITGQIPSFSIQITAGAGGNGKSGGTGGNVQVGKLTGPSGAASLGSASVAIFGGAGGQGTVTSGGAGGPVLGVGSGTNISLGGDFNELVVFGGQGGNGVTTGGAGGMVKGLKLNFTGALSNSLGNAVYIIASGLHQIQGGVGGDASGATGTGGAGGMVLGVNYKAMNGAAVLNQLNIFGGAGGKGTAHNGGAGGILDTASVTFMGSVLSQSQFGGGAGGDGAKLGGSGGKTKSVNVTLNNAFFNIPSASTFVGLIAGKGGDLLGTTAISGSQGGAGGAVDSSTFKLNSGGGTEGVGILVLAGNGGQGGMTAGHGGKGANITNTNVIVGGGNVGVGFEAGIGGDAGTKANANGNGGGGGNVSNCGVNVLGSSIDADVFVGVNGGGNGGSGIGSGAGGVGGGVNHFTVTGGAIGYLQIRTGSGGSGGENGGNGGSAGGLTNSSFSPVFIIGGIEIYTGGGGGINSNAGVLSTFGNAGNGGAISNVTIHTGTVGGLGLGGAIVVATGAGGDTDKPGVFAGTGGAITNFQIDTQNVVDGGVYISAGAGGNGVSVAGNVTAKGGTGGKIEGSKFNFGVVSGLTQIVAGVGGSGTTGGTGGLSRNNSLTLAGTATGEQGTATLDPLAAAQTVFLGLDFAAGNGGEGGLGPNFVAPSTGNGGSGGSFLQNTITITGPMTSGDTMNNLPLLVNVRAGNGGNAGAVSGTAGNGGILNDLQLTYADAQASVTIRGGNGGEATLGNAGNGGLLTNVQVTHYGNYLASSSGVYGSTLAIRGGDGGSMRNGNGNGGAGAKASFVDVQNFGGLTALNIEGGAGGSGAFAFNPAGPLYDPFLPTFTGGNGSGGKAGDVTNSTITSYGEVPYILVAGGAGGNAGDIAGGAVIGGIGGSSLDNSITYYGPAGTSVLVNAGVGGNAMLPGGTGGDSGSVQRIALDVASGSVGINANSTDGYYGDGGSGATKAGNGGIVNKIHGTVDHLVIYAPNAGFTLNAAGNGGTAGIPGNGGSISNLNFPVVNGIIGIIQAGSGSSIVDDFSLFNIVGIGGQGGSINDVTADGGIVDLRAGASSGGINGTHGSVKIVQAANIGNIFAFDYNMAAILPLAALQGVFVTQAQHIGYDDNGDGHFDFLHNGNPATEPSTMFNFSSLSDQLANDSIVVVKASGLGAQHSTIFKLITV